MRGILQSFLNQIFRTGTLELTTAAGQILRVGDGSGNPVRLKLADFAAERELLLNPELALGELFTDGRLVMVEGSIYDLLTLGASNIAHGTLPGAARGHQIRRRILRLLHQRNSPLRATRNVAHHYDLSGRLYDLFLDADKQYSCAYFEAANATLDEAQLAKKRHIAAKLLIEPNMRVLDIGCGWGGLGIYLAEVCSADVTGITLSQEQLRIARRRAAASPVSRRLSFTLQDYRFIAEQYDRVVSVGMFEHVGVGYYDTFFSKVHDLLRDDGVMLLHSIGRMDGPGATNPWIDKYIFPGGYAPALSEVLPAIERCGLIVTDIEILRLHYAETLRNWRQRFMIRRAEAAAIYDERFCRMWEFYLATSEVSFRYSGLMVFQIQLSKRQDAVPLTRDYITSAEEILRTRERAASNETRFTEAAE